jgi:hypothetical protein
MRCYLREPALKSVKRAPTSSGRNGTYTWFGPLGVNKNESSMSTTTITPTKNMGNMEVMNHDDGPWPEGVRQCASWRRRSV